MEPTVQVATEFKKHSIYLELLGNGLSYSINYERLLKQRLSLRMGAGYFPDLDDFLPTLVILASQFYLIL